MAQTSVFGVNSGFDTAKVVQQLVDLQARPIEINLAKRDNEVEKLTTFQDLKARLQTFRTTLNTINTTNRFISNQGDFTPTGTTISDIVDITPTSTATSGSFTLEVTSLAQEAKIASAGFQSITSAIPTGIFELKVGDQTTFINIDATNNSLDGLRLAINNSGAEVTATFLDDGSSDTPLRLVISGNNTGAANTVDARIFSVGLGSGETDVMTFTDTQTPKDAILKLDGIDISKASNTVSDIVPGTILQLNGTGTGIINLTTDLGDITSKVTDFVNSYNDLIEYIQGQLTFDPDTLETGDLFGNFAVQNLQNTLRGVATGQVTGVTGQFQFLSQIGITTQSDGKLVLDTNKLSDSLTSDTVNVSQLFATRATTTNSNVSFVGLTNDTQAGIYELRVLNGVPQLSKQGENNFVDAVGSGTFYRGAAGTDAEGLNFRIASLADGDYGQINVSIGIAEELNRDITFLTDGTQQGPITTEIDTITKTIDELDETLFSLDDRLEEFERSIRERFVNLEIILGRLNTQKESFASSIAGLGNLFGGG